METNPRVVEIDEHAAFAQAVAKTLPEYSATLKAMGAELLWRRINSMLDWNGGKTPEPASPGERPVVPICEDCGEPANGPGDAECVNCDCGAVVCSACCESLDGESYCRGCVIAKMRKALAASPGERVPGGPPDMPSESGWYWARWCEPGREPGPWTCCHTAESDAGDVDLEWGPRIPDYNGAAAPAVSPSLRDERAEWAAAMRYEAEQHPGSSCSLLRSIADCIDDGSFGPVAAPASPVPPGEREGWERSFAAEREEVARLRAAMGRAVQLLRDRGHMTAINVQKAQDLLDTALSSSTTAKDPDAES